tara:strand:- start:606 stop:1358 length:753 start_codon:yes stop_codon:yes gene_type:complete
MDFTLKTYEDLLKSLIDQNYTFLTFEEFLKSESDKTIILRHDVDLMPYNSLAFAKIQHRHNVKGVYYFRAVKESWNENIIKEISNLGHEIGYHYENLSFCKGDYNESIKDFKYNLKRLRKLAPVSTICMHGSPLSKFDSRDLWTKYNYSDFDIKGEPYFDIDFNNVHYFTDTGRKWDGEKVSVRDKVKTNNDITFSSTKDIIRSAKNGTLPKKIMFTFHPQRWNDNLFYWVKELILQNLKNIIKRLILVK